MGQAPVSEKASGRGWPGTLRSWYGWQVLISDAASLTLVAAEAASGSDSSGRRGAVTLGGLGYVLAPAIIHIVHGRVAMAPASVGVRLFVPVAGMLLGSAADDCQNPTDGQLFCHGAVPGLLVGLAVASALDAGLFSWENPPREARTKPELGFTPVLSPDGKRAELRAYGTF